MKEYLTSFFDFNDKANGAILKRIGELPDPSECIRLFSHLINSQNKWMARITHQANAHERSWWNPIFPYDDLQDKWNESIAMWLSFTEKLTEKQLFREVQFIGQDGEMWAATLKDIPLQLNYHSIHHRAQMQMLIRTQGLTPDFIDYIGTVYKKLNPQR